MLSEYKAISLGTLAEGVAVAVAAGFVVSVIYDWGFFYALGLDFAKLHTTTTDHFRSGLLWFPYLLFFLLGSVAIEFQFKRIERGLNEKEIIESASNPERMRKFREGPWKLMAWTAPLYVIIYVLIGDVFASILPLMLSIVWMGFAEWCYAAPLIKIRRSRQVQFGFTFLPIIVIVAFFSGYNAALDATVRKPSKVTIERSAPSASVSGNILRTFEKGVLILDDRNSYHFIPWNQVHAIQNNKPYKPFRGIACEWFKLCRQEPYGTSNKPIQPNAKPSD